MSSKIFHNKRSNEILKGLEQGNTMFNNEKKVRPVFICGAKNIGQYGGYETFLDELTGVHESDQSIQYYITAKANGDGAMDESKLSHVSGIKRNKDGSVRSFNYHNAHVIKLNIPQIGPAQAIAYDIKAFKWCLNYISDHRLNNAIIYVLACRMGPFFGKLVTRAHNLGVKVYVNPDGHEWMRAKWSRPVQVYWKESERVMVKYSDLLICDSMLMEKYIKEEYKKYTPQSVYIAYGADVKKCEMSDDDPLFKNWMRMNGLKQDSYYMCCGRFVPENSFEIMIREFMRSRSTRDFVIITTKNKSMLKKLDKELHWRCDNRIKIVDAVYDKQLLKKIRENAYGNFHGHTVGGSNPTLLEALGSTDLNLLIDVGFNREIAEDAALYWTKDEGDLSKLIDAADVIDSNQRAEYGRKAKERIKDAYSWEFIGSEYKKLWTL